MPQICSFYGITIWMYYDETHHHEGRPHFHARYGEAEAAFDFENLTVLAGRLPPRARRLVSDGAAARQTELTDNWRRAREHRPLIAIEPLS
jgi:hypothetical protein